MYVEIKHAFKLHVTVSCNWLAWLPLSIGQDATLS
jgi:hypothetical protein